MPRCRSFAAAVALAASALAASPAAAQSDGARVAETMRDPVLQSTVSAAARTMGEAMLDLPVGPFLRAAEAIRDPAMARTIDPQLTLGDIAGPEAGHVPEDLSRRVPAMMGAMGGMADAVDAVTPVLGEMAREMSRAMEAAIGQAAAAGLGRR